MRFAPPNPLRIADRASGLNAPSVRSYNERLVLSLLLQNEGMSRLEIGERTGLSAQTISVIVRSLEQEGLVAKGEAQRGRVGPPTIPLSLNPDGAYAVGVSFGAKAVDVVLVDFVGNVRRHTAHAYDLFRAGSGSSLVTIIGQALAAVPAGRDSRIAGIGLAVPDDAAVGDNVRALLGHDFPEAQRRMEHELRQPVFMQNDITAAAGSESLFGVARSLSDFVFFYLGSRLHNRLVLNHQIHTGSGTALDHVGLGTLDEALAASGSSLNDLNTLQHLSPAALCAEARWRDECCRTIVGAVNPLLQFVDLKALVLSTYAPPGVTGGLVSGLADALPGIQILAGRNSAAPKAIGAASLPYHSRLMVQ